MTIAASDISFNTLNLELGRTGTNALSINDSAISSLLLNDAVSNQNLNLMKGSGANGATWQDLWFQPVKTDIAYLASANTYCIVTDSPYVLVSTDNCTTYTRVDLTSFPGAGSGFNCITAMPGVGFVACPKLASGGIFRSTNGISWTTATNPAPVVMTSVAYGNNNLVAVGSGYSSGDIGYQIYSTNSGLSWSMTNVNGQSNWKPASVATNGAGTWVAAGAGLNAGYYICVYTSANNGVTWSSTVIGQNGYFDKVAYASALGLWVIAPVNPGQGGISTSTNGTSWTYSGDVGSPYSIQSLTSDGSNFYSSGYYSGVYVTWQFTSSSTFVTKETFPYNAGGRVLKASSKIGEVFDLGGYGHLGYRSTNTATSFQQITQVPEIQFGSAASNGSLIAAVNKSSYNTTVTKGIFTSPDGVTWTQRVSNENMLCVAWTGNYFIAGGFWIFTSPDGITWTRQTFSPGGLYNFSRAFGVGSKMFIFNTQGTPAVSLAYSTNSGVTWTTSTGVLQTVFSYQNAWTGKSSVQAMAYNGTNYVAVGSTSTVCYSSDGISWSSTTAPWSSISDVTWNGSRFIGVSDYHPGVSNYGVVSQDGITWTLTTLPSGNTFQSISSATSGRVVASAGSNGIYYGNSTGSTWTSVVTFDKTSNLTNLTSINSFNLVNLGNSTVALTGNNRVMISPPNGNQQVF